MSAALLSEIAEQLRGVSYGKSDVTDRATDGYIPVLRANNITEVGLAFDDLVYVRSNKVAQRQKIKSGDIVIAASSGSISVVGKAAQAEFDIDAGFGAFCKVVRPSAKVNARYLGHFFKTTDYRQRMSTLAAGANINNLKNEHIDDLLIPLPPLDEQKRIAAILDQAEALRRLRRRTLDRLNALSQAIFYDMFGDLINNSKAWEIRKFGDVGQLDRGISKHRPRNDPKLLGGSYPLVQTGDIANADGFVDSFKSTYSDLGLSQSKLWPKGTLCITIAANIGKAAILKFDACFPDSVVGFTEDENVLVEYIQYWMRSIQSKLESEAPQSAQKNINLSILRNLDLPLPPIDLQRKFSNLIGAIEDHKFNLKVASAKEDRLFASLQSRAFRGEL